jgi:hypothetical protein
MIMEKRIVDVTLKISVPEYYTPERVEKCVHTSSVLSLVEIGVDVIETECKAKWIVEGKK